MVPRRNRPVVSRRPKQPTTLPEPRGVSEVSRVVRAIGITRSRLPVRQIYRRRAPHEVVRRALARGARLVPQ